MVVLRVSIIPSGLFEVFTNSYSGGSEALSKAMTVRIRTKPQHYMRLVAVKETDGGQTLTITFDSNHNPRPSAQRRTEKKYTQVISTMSLGCLRMVDLDQLQMSYGQRNAIRELIYTPSIKIGIQFKTAWWEKLGIIGGQSSTDRPIRDIVYPSYGPDESHPGNQKSNCMIASYNGMQDSQRLGGLMKGRDTPQERIMIDLVMRDLAAVHKVDVEQLWDEFEDYHAWDFYRDEFQLGKLTTFSHISLNHHPCRRVLSIRPQPVQALLPLSHPTRFSGPTVPLCWGCNQHLPRVSQEMFWKDMSAYSR